MPFWVKVVFLVGFYIGGAIVTGLIISKGDKELDMDNSWVAVFWPILLICLVPALPAYGLTWLINKIKGRM